MSQPETPRERRAGVRTRSRARKEEESEVWEKRPVMGGPKDGGEGVTAVASTSEPSRARDVDDQYHSVQNGSADSSPNKTIAAESFVTSRNKAIMAKRRAELMAKKRGIVPGKPEARKEVLRKYMPELTLKMPQMADEIQQGHLLSSTSSEGSGEEATPPPHKAQAEYSAPPQEVSAPGKDDIEWGGDVAKGTARLITQLTANGESGLDTNTVELGLGTLRAVAGGSLSNQLSIGEVPPSVALLYKESEVVTHSPLVVSSQQRASLASTSRGEGARETGPGASSRQPSAERKRRNLRSSAITLARKMLGVKEQYTRIRGFVAQGHVNAPFCAAVCAALVGRVTLDSLRRSGASRLEGKVLINNITLWSGRDAGSPPEKKSELGGEKVAGTSTEEALAQLSLSRGLVDAEVDVSRLAGEALILNKPLVSLLLPERICPICVIQHLAGEQGDVKLVEGQQPYMDTEALTGLILMGSNGALEAMAAAHNQEMHAMNGNINFSVIHDTARADVMAAALTRATRGVRHRHAIQVETERRLRVAQEEVPMLVYTSNVANGVGLVSAPPTRHQIFWFYGSLAQPGAPEPSGACAEASVSSPAASVLEATGTAPPPPASVISMWVARMSRAWRGVARAATRDNRRREMGGFLAAMAAQNTAARNIMGYDPVADEHDLMAVGAETRELTWIGVKEDPVYSKGGLVLTALSTDLKRTVDDPSSRDGRVNATRPTTIWRYIADSPLLQATLVDGSQVSTMDITGQLIKMRLYDHLRHMSCAFPTGTEWGIPMKGEVPRMARVVPEIDDEWQVAAVSARYLDEIMHRQTRTLSLLNGESWCIDDPRVAVVVIDHASANTQLMWALQIVLAAPYPLIELDELFVVTGPGGVDACRLAAMRRNECCVTIENRRRKFLLVTATGEATIVVAGVEVMVAGLNRDRNPEMVVSQPAAELLQACLDRIMRSPTPLKVTMEQWLSSRMTATFEDYTHQKCLGIKHFYADFLRLRCGFVINLISRQT